MPTGIYKRTKSVWNKGLRYENGNRGGGYHAVHKWLEKHFGKACKCDNDLCDGLSKRFHWAKKKSMTYEHKRENFFMLCASCHRKYDLTKGVIDKMAQTKRGRHLSNRHKMAISRGCKGIHLGNNHAAISIVQRDLLGNFIKTWVSATEAARKLGLSKTGITMTCRGQIKKSGGFLWNYQNSALV